MIFSEVFKSVHRCWKAFASYQFLDLRLKFGRRLILMQALLGLLCISIGAGWLFFDETADTLAFWQIILFLAIPTLLFTTGYFFWVDFLRPMLHLDDWVLKVRAGELAARISPIPGSEFEELRENLNSLSRMLEFQSMDAERQVQRHTQHMLEKNRSLGALYRISSSLNILSELGDLFTNVMETLEDIFNTKATIIRQRLNDGRLRYVTSRGDVPSDETHEFIRQDSYLLKISISRKRYVVPIQHGGKNLGACSFYLDEEMFHRLGDMKDLLASVGLHLGMAMEKFRLELENRQLSIVEERNWLAHELHDSLAQIISSLRLQARILKNALDNGESSAAIDEKLQQLETSVEAANREAREMIMRFRSSDVSVPQPKRRRHGLEMVDKYIAQFRQENPETQIYLQRSLLSKPLSQSYEIEVCRIIREAVVNAHKHAKADFIRVLMRSNEAGNYRILIEDDGVGLQNPTESQRHFGLEMMKECASRINGQLGVEGEANEGVRVTLKFTVP